MERVKAYHMDEYIGLDKDAPQGGNFLKAYIFGLVPFKSVNYIDITTQNPDAEAERYGKLLEEILRISSLWASGKTGILPLTIPPVADFKDEKR